MVEREHILAEIRRTAEGNGGKPLRRGRFRIESGISDGDWRGRYWARWGDAVLEAGYAPNHLQQRIADDVVLSQLIPEVRRLGRLPTISELDMRRRENDGFPSRGVVTRLGPKQTLAFKLADYCKERPDCADVLQIIEPLLATPEVPGDDNDEPSELGYVYLMKSGRYYKLGRTNSVGRREYELTLQLPEQAVGVHAITTDDPVGIENYWHRRFADKRKRGEWFELTQADVKAFKRRKFM